MESTLIVLRDSVSPTELEELAAKSAWQLTEDRPRSKLDEPFQRAYQTVGGVELRYVEDHLINVKTLGVSGENCVAECELARQNLAHFTKEEALSECSTAAGNILIGALYKVCRFGQDSVDKEILAIYEKAACHEALGVRRASITAMAYTPWKECLVVLDDLARRDSRLRAKALQLAEAIDPSRKVVSVAKPANQGKKKQKNRNRR